MSRWIYIMNIYFQMNTYYLYIYALFLNFKHTGNYLIMRESTTHTPINVVYPKEQKKRGVSQLLWA